jgi:arginase family enzyme
MGRCAAGLGTLPAVAAAHPEAAIVWFDAHGDCNAPRFTTSGYLGGMVLTGAAGHWETGLGAGLDLARVVLVGARDLDPCERDLIENGTIRLVEAGPGVADRLREALAGRRAYVHLDCDVLDPGLVPTEYEVEGGLSFADLRAACAVIAESGAIGAEIAEFETAWRDGRPGDAAPLAAALAPLYQSV